MTVSCVLPQKCSGDAHDTAFSEAVVKATLDYRFEKKFRKFAKLFYSGFFLVSNDNMSTKDRTSWVNS